MTTSATTGTGFAASEHAPASPAHRIGLAVAALAWVGTASVLLAQPQVPLDRLQLLPTTLTAVCGAIIVLRTETRSIGWLLVVAGVTWPLVSPMNPLGPAPPPATDWNLFLLDIGTIGNTCVLLLLLIYPTGRFDSRPARIGGVIFVLPAVLYPFHLLAVLGVIDAVPDVPEAVQILGFGVFVLLGLGIQIRRYRHRPRVEQLQIKWLLLAIASFLAYPVIILLDLPLGPVPDIVITAAIPIAVLVAITRYRLYEIDRILSRTVAYALVLGLLGLVFVGGVATVTSLLPSQDRLAVALTTVIVLALFNPLRRRVIEAVDRRFNRTRYIAQQVVEGFGRDVRDVTDLEEIGDRVHAVVGATLAPATVAVWQPRTGGTS